jgi:hypothetical protein
MNPFMVVPFQLSAGPATFSIGLLLKVAGLYDKYKKEFI